MPCIIDITPSLSTAIGFVHAGLASRSLCAQIFGAWGDTDTAQVEAIGVPTGQNGRIPLGHAIAVVHTGELKQIHFFISGIKVMASQAAGKRCAACAMTIVHVFVESAGIVKKGKQFHHVPIGACLFCQHEAVCPYTRPVRDAVVAPPIDLELLTQMLKEVVAAVEKHYKLK